MSVLINILKGVAVCLKFFREFVCSNFHRDFFTFLVCIKLVQISLNEAVYSKFFILIDMHKLMGNGFSFVRAFEEKYPVSQSNSISFSINKTKSIKQFYCFIV